MNEQLRAAILGGVIGAVLSLAAVFAAGQFGLLPGTTDARLHAYLVAHPYLLVEMTDKLQKAEADKEQQGRQAAIDKVGLKRFFDPSVAYVTGPANAKNTVVEFFDYNCVHCRNTFAAVKKYYDAHKGDTRFAFIEYPIFGDASNAAARAAVAARQQGDRYLALHFLLMSEKDSIDNTVLLADAKKAGLDIAKLNAALLTPDLNRPIVAAHKLGEQAKVDATPTFIVNGKLHLGEITEADFKKLTKN